MVGSTGDFRVMYSNDFFYYRNLHLTPDLIFMEEFKNKFSISSKISLVSYDVQIENHEVEKYEAAVESTISSFVFCAYI